MYYIGIDPGQTGAMAVITPTQEIWIYDFKDPAYAQCLMNLSPVSDTARAVIEKVGSMKGWGTSTTFKFGTAYGQALGMLTLAGVAFDMATPARWQKEVYDYLPGKSVDKKAFSLERARRMFPQAAQKYLARKSDHNRADALLIAEYCRRKYGRISGTGVPLDFLA